MKWAAIVLALAACSSFAQSPPAARQAALLELVRQDCGACHGLTLKGGLGPSLEPLALAGKDVEFLSYVVLHGRRGTPMPPWRAHLSQAEAQWVVEQLKKGLPR